jgi:hypothetical protein
MAEVPSGRKILTGQREVLLLYEFKSVRLARPVSRARLDTRGGGEEQSHGADVLA